MTENEKKKLSRLIYCSPAFGFILYAIYYGIQYLSGISLNFKNIDTLATIVAGFSFTMLGFLAAISAIIFSLQKYKFFRRWTEDGGAEIFFKLYMCSIICLFITFGLSILVYSECLRNYAFKFMLISLSNNIIQVISITLIINNHMSKAKAND